MDGSDLPFLSDGERRFLQALNTLDVRFLVVGMGAALLLGARGSTEDIDLWFETTTDPGIADAAREASGFWITRSSPPMLGGFTDKFDVVMTMSGLPDFAAEYAGSQVVELDGISVRALGLDRILHSKRLAGRAKDKSGIAQIELALSVARALSAPIDEP